MRLMNLINYILSFNAILLKGTIKRGVGRKTFVHLVIPRISVCYGNTININEFNREQLFGVQCSHDFIAGETVERAYRFEKQAAPFGIFIEKEVLNNIFSENYIWTIKGRGKIAYEYLQSCCDDDGYYKKYNRYSDGAMLPWILLAPRHNFGNRIHKAKTEDIKIRAMLLKHIIDLFWIDFRTRTESSEIDPMVCKNIGQMDRMLLDHLSIIGKRKKPDNDINKLINNIVGKENCNEIFTELFQM